jgi:nitrogen fixation/metabolism regulation signal transduction histidine kinase
MKKMVNAFSEYARIPQISLEPMDLHQLIQEVLDLYRSNDASMELIEQLQAHNHVIDGDPGRLRQLLHNLLKNSLEACRDAGHVRICVATRNEISSGHQQIVMTITDNGPGFAPGIMENLFEPYVSTKPRGGGLGLAIVKKIVEEHAGTISADTLESGGAQVIIRLLQSAGHPAGSSSPVNSAVPAAKSGL